MQLYAIGNHSAHGSASGLSLEPFMLRRNCSAGVFCGKVEEECAARTGRPGKQASDGIAAKGPGPPVAPIAKAIGKDDRHLYLPKPVKPAWVGFRPAGARFVEALARSTATHRTLLLADRRTGRETELIQSHHRTL